MNPVRARVTRVVEALREVADPVRREKTLGYFPSALTILGVSAPNMRAVLRPLAREVRDEPAAVVLSLARALLDTRVHEARQVAFELVGGRKDVVADLDGPAVEALGEGNDNWASVDGFSVYVSGPAWRDGGVEDADIARWTVHEDRWWRRTALVSTVPLNARSRGGRGDPVRTLRVCRALAADADPMVSKALSWALRTLVAVDAEAVRAFLEAHGAQVASLVRREVGNKLETGTKRGVRR